MIDRAQAIGMLRAIPATPATPLVRVAPDDAAQIMHLLDAGAFGIVCPMITTPAPAAACLYPPVGSRSFGPSRGPLHGGADDVAGADATVMAIPMIETAEGVERIGEILDVEGIDMLSLGPNGMAIALDGHAGQPRPKSEAATRRGLPVGIFCASGEDARRRIGEGFRLVTPGNGFGHLDPQPARRGARGAGRGPGRTRRGPHRRLRPHGADRGPDAAAGGCRDPARAPDGPFRRDGGGPPAGRRRDRGRARRRRRGHGGLVGRGPRAHPRHRLRAGGSRHQRRDPGSGRHPGRISDPRRVGRAEPRLRPRPGGRDDGHGARDDRRGRRPRPCGPPRCRRGAVVVPAGVRPLPEDADGRSLRAGAIVLDPLQRGPVDMEAFRSLRAAFERARV